MHESSVDARRTCLLLTLYAHLYTAVGPEAFRDCGSDACAPLGRTGRLLAVRAQHQQYYTTTSQVVQNCKACARLPPAPAPLAPAGVAQCRQPLLRLRGANARMVVVVVAVGVGVHEEDQVHGEVLVDGGLKLRYSSGGVRARRGAGRTVSRR